MQKSSFSATPKMRVAAAVVALRWWCRVAVQLYFYGSEGQGSYESALKTAFFAILSDVQEREQLQCKRNCTTPSRCFTCFCYDFSVIFYGGMQRIAQLKKGGLVIYFLYIKKSEIFSLTLQFAKKIGGIRVQLFLAKFGGIRVRSFCKSR